MEVPIPSTQPIVEPPRPEPHEAVLRTDFVEAYGPRVFMALAAVATLFLVPFTINNFAEGRVWLGGATSILIACLIANASAIARGNRVPIPSVFFFAPALAALVIAMYEQGLVGILWAYAAILLFHFVLPRRTANIFNGTIVLVAIPMAWMHLGTPVTIRVGATLLLTMLFTNIFSYIADAQRRKEAEQRQRLDLLMRGTNAGTLEWDADGRTYFSRRLRQMLGRRLDNDRDSWRFIDFVHPDDRKAVEALIRARFHEKGPPRTVLHQPPQDYRLLHASGSVLWVHVEGITVTDARGRTRRYVCAFTDITERVRQQEELVRSHEQVREQARQLEAQNGALRDAIRAREEVERIARHDLRTPLASIASVPRLLREGRVLAPREEELLGMVEHAALRVLSMVNLSLDLYRMEAGTYRLRPQAVDLGALARTVAAEVRGHADSKQLALEIVAPPQPLYAHAEELLCYAILGNLLKNALEAAPEGGVVKLALEAGRWEGGDGVLLHIHNAGAVPKDIRAKFFEKYATSGKPGGTGLGAYSARLMARVQLGDLRMVTSDAQGTTLTLCLPLAHAPAAVSVQPRADAQPAGTRPAAALPALSVLLVDDDPYNILVLKSMLPSPPLQVDVAINGRAALERAQRARPDVIFLDLQMPVMDGLEALVRIRSLQKERGQRPSTVIAFSARDDDSARMQCRRAGFDHYLVKPASREEIFALLRDQADLSPTASVDRAADEMAALLPQFVASRRPLLQQLCDAADQGQRDAVRSTAHLLAGSFGMYGFRQAGRLSRHIESNASSQELPWLRDRCQELVAQFERDQAASRVPTP